MEENTEKELEEFKNALKASQGRKTNLHIPYRPHIFDLLIGGQGLHIGTTCKSCTTIKYDGCLGVTYWHVGGKLYF